jgi:hypothetical protein
MFSFGADSVDVCAVLYLVLQLNGMVDERRISRIAVLLVRLAFCAKSAFGSEFVYPTCFGMIIANG